jgi:YidC/Oxa1 family membrane protein insertase
MKQPSHFNNDSQKRLFAVMILSFTFFFIYDYFFIPKNVISYEQNNTSNTFQSQDARQHSNVAPKIPSKISKDVAPKAISIIASLKPLVVIKNENFDIYIDKFARISQIIMKHNTYDNVNLLDENYVKPLEIRFSNDNINDQAFTESYKTSKKTYILRDKISFTLTQKLSKTIVKKYFTFFSNGTYTIKVSSSTKESYYITPGFRPSAQLDDFVFHGALLKLKDDTLDMIDDGDLSSSKIFHKAQIVSGVDKYYVSMFYDFNNGLNGITDVYNDDNPLIFVEGKNNQIFNGYIGEKNYKHLSDIDERLTDVIDYGFITFFAKPIFTVLSFLHTYTLNWGWAIVVLTLLIRLALYPLTYKGMVSMNKIKELAPKVKEIQAKYKGDSQRSGVAMMELYKKHNANPMGGCLPFIIQIPVFFAIYRTLLNSIELNGSEWILWIDNLALQDPYYVLPILMGASMYIQQVITPSTLTDPMQQKLFRFLPVIMTVFFLTFPSGLVLYWFINNLFSIAQQYYINKLFEKQKQKSNK